jgi:hypothetical protein
MKQPEDNKTRDMWDEEETEAAPVPVPQTQPKEK